MRLHRVEVRNFRSIQCLDWNVDGDLVALIGPGDSGKSTILDAIEFALSPRWAVALTENDFHNCDVTRAIDVTCYVADLPPALITDRRFGLDLQGVSPTGALHDEPEVSDTPVLAVRFRFDNTYEPTWSVVNARLPPEGKSISSADRRHFGLIRLGSSPDRHLGWAQGSALAQLTQSGSGLSALVAEATREMRESMRGASLPAFDDALEAASKAATRFGVGSVGENLTAQLSAESFDIRNPTLNLHSSNIPLARSGLGTRRLVALALQHEALSAGGIALIDEVEAGLEPYRLRHLLGVLEESIGGEHGQIILTTHASTVVEELPVTHLAIVRRALDGSVTSVTHAPIEVQKLVRSNSESLFGRRLVVCEGKTEVGVLRGLRSAWTARNGSPPGHHGVVFTEGGGSETQQRTLGLVALGFKCIVLADSDVEIDPNGLMESAGVTVVRWKDQTAVDQRLMLDPSLPAVLQLLEIAVAEFGFESVESQIVGRIPGASCGRTSVEDLVDLGIPALRAASAEAAKKNGWFKRIDLGEAAGHVIGEELELLSSSDIGFCLNKIETWVYDDAQ